MNLGTFSVSLTVKNIEKSKAFYEALGFAAMLGCGSLEEKWLILKNEGVVIGLFEGMFDENILTFNPSDARAIEAKLINQEISILQKTQGDSGPTHFTLKDPDDNLLMFDQF